jgi:splicing factor 3B subunit 4
MSAAIEQRNQDATCYIGNLDEKVQEELLWELMLQCGPVVNVHMPKDKVTGKHQGYGFVEFRGEEDAEYCMKVMNMVKLYGKALKVNKASQDKRQTDVGANIFIGNLDPEVDEKILYDTFSAFGGILQTPKIMRDPETGFSKGYGFISFENFEASDLAIESMNGQYLYNRVIVCQYAFKKDSQGERHGSQAERLLAASQPQRFKAHTFFSSGSGDLVNMGSTATIAGLQFQQQQQQLQAQMQLSAYGGMGYGGMGLPMQIPGMPMIPPTGYIPPAPPMIIPGMPMPPPPPPPTMSTGYSGYGITGGTAQIPPPPPPSLQ